MVKSSDQSCAVLGSRAQRSWPRFKNFPIMCQLFKLIRQLWRLLQDMEKYINKQMKELEDRTKIACDMRIATYYGKIENMMVSFPFLCLKAGFWLDFFSNFRGMKEKKLTTISENYR